VIKKFLAAAMFAATAVWAVGTELIGNPNAWWMAEQDEKGSSVVDFVNGNNTPLNAVFDLEDEGWATVSSAFSKENVSFEGLKSVTINYKSTGKLRFILMTGIYDGSAFRKELDASTEFATVNIPLSEIQRPDWAGLTGEMDVSKVLGDVLGVGLTVPYGSGGEMTVTSIMLNFEDDNEGGGDITGDVIELMGNNAAGILWSADVDNKGSTATIVGDVQNPLNVVMVIETDGWAAVTSPKANALNLTGLKSIDITYKATGTFRLSFLTGITDGSAFKKELDASEDFVTAKIPLSEIARPNWSGLEGEMDVRKVLETVSGFGLTVPYGSGGEMTVTSIKLNFTGDDGFEGEGGSDNISKLRTVKSANIAITGISSGRLNLNVSSAGNYSIAIYSVDGRMLAQTKANLVKGINTLSISNNLARGVAIVRVQGANATAVKKITVK